MVIGGNDVNGKTKNPGGQLFVLRESFEASTGTRVLAGTTLVLDIPG